MVEKLLNSHKYLEACALQLSIQGLYVAQLQTHILIQAELHPHPRGNSQAPGGYLRVAQVVADGQHDEVGGPGIHDGVFDVVVPGHGTDGTEHLLHHVLLRGEKKTGQKAAERVGDFGKPTRTSPSNSMPRVVVIISYKEQLYPQSLSCHIRDLENFLPNHQ